MRHKIFDMEFAKIYDAYLKKVERKSRSEAELRSLLTWYSGYDDEDLSALVKSNITLESFFTEAPALHPKRELISGKICGITVQEIEDPLMKKIRQVDKIVDELAKGKSLEKITNL